VLRKITTQKWSHPCEFLLRARPVRTLAEVGPAGLGTLAQLLPDQCGQVLDGRLCPLRDSLPDSGLRGDGELHEDPLSVAAARLSLPGSGTGWVICPSISFPASAAIAWSSPLSPVAGSCRRISATARQ
jgi:hypothetical protein